MLSPIYLLILTYVAKYYRDKRYPKGHLLRPYYLRGLYIKFAGAVFIALVYEYYYGGGDTYNYFHQAKVINSSLSNSLETWFKLIFNYPVETNPELYPYVSQLIWYDGSAYMVSVIAALLGLFSGTTYIPIALLFAYFSFTGVWAMYRTFVGIYPKLYKELAVVFFFIPSTFVWGSAVFKDTICMFGLGWLTYTTFRIFINRDFSRRNFFMLTLSFYLIYSIKIYILLGFLPALSVWLLTTYSAKIRIAGIRFMSKVIFIVIAIIGFFFFSRIFAKELERYSLDNIADTAATTRSYIFYISGEEGSAYDLGEFDPSIGGILKKFPQAVVVTLFRPFLWEARKVIVILSALEALLFLYFTVKAFTVSGLKVTIRLIGKDPNLLFFLVFSLVFAFAVGISSYNFGALSRYKIPCLPYYGAFLVVLIYHQKLNTEPSIQSKRLKKSVAFS